jgi:uncharacterized membrane protein
VRWIHIAAGMIGIVSGLIALASLKGATLHRRSGIVFVASMLVMSSTGALLAVLRQPAAVATVNALGGLLTFYLVATALLTVRRPADNANRLDMLAVLAGVTLCIGCIGLGLAKRGLPPEPGGYPAAAYFVLAVLLAWLAVQDVRMAAGRLQGNARLRRHLGRMGGGLVIATTSFFVGNPQVFAGGPLEPIGLRVIPVLTVMTPTLYWLARLARSRAPTPQRS